ncbi:MAG: ABC transporter ATP-binding protein [Candidatus Desantisbacteria bacterium]
MKTKHLQIVNLTVLSLIMLILPSWLHTSGNIYFVHILCLIGIYIIISLGLNIVIGFTGLLDLGFIAFYAIGAYTSALLTIHFHLPFWIVLIMSAIVSVFFRLLLGLSVLRLRGDYLAIVTLGFGEIVRIVLNNLDTITNGPKGLPGVNQTIYSPNIFGFTLQDDIHFYYLIFFFVAASIIIIQRLDNSSIGRAWAAIREDEIAAEAMGINTTKLKLFAFSLSAVFAGISGCIYAHWIGFITPESFSFWESIFVVCMIVLGGMGNIPGVILGVILLVGIPEILRGVLGPEFVEYRMLLFGGIMIIMVILRPQGIIPSKRRSFELHPETEKLRDEEDESLYDALHDREIADR